LEIYDSNNNSKVNFNNLNNQTRDVLQDLIEDIPYPQDELSLTSVSNNSTPNKIPSKRGLKNNQGMLTNSTFSNQNVL
jgi:hypothetical protein